MYIDLSKTEITKGPGGEIISEEREEYEKVFLAKVSVTRNCGVTGRGVGSVTLNSSRPDRSMRRSSWQRSV
jgi:hypothetical protein